MARTPVNPNASYEKLLTAAKAARAPYEREWWLNLAFYLNQMYTEWHAAENEAGYLRAIPQGKKGEERPRPKFNKIMHYVREAHAEALQDEPQGDVLPATDDITDMSDAQVAKAYIDWVADPTMADWDSTLSRAVLWAIICGDGWKKWHWNATEQKMSIDPVSPFELYVDPYASDFKKARYVIHSQYMDVEAVYDRWGVELPPESVQGVDKIKTQMLRDMGCAPVLSGVTVNELWHKPSRRHPNGLFVVWAGVTNLETRPSLPYDVCRTERKLPFTQVGIIERPDSLYHLSPVEYLRSGQMALNQYWAQRIMNNDNFANGKWLIHNNYEGDLPDNSANQVLRGEWEQGFEPRMLQATPFPNTGDGEAMEQQTMHIVGQHEVSQGQVPGRVEAAKAIEMLKDSDANALSHLRKTIRRSNSDGWYMTLCLAKQYEKPEVMVTAYSREGVAEVKRFKAGELKPGFRIRTTMTTGLARSRAARQDLLMRLWDSKVITDAELMADLMDVPAAHFVAHKAADVRLAKNENYELAKGVAIVPNSWDEHGLHLREHNTYRKTSEFMQLDIDTKQKFEHHCQEHRTLLKVQLKEQVELAMIAQGGQPVQPGAAAAPPTEPPAPGNNASGGTQ